MSPPEFDIIREPRARTEEEERLLAELADIQSEYRERAAPVVERLAEIDASFAPKFMLVPKTRSEW